MTRMMLSKIVHIHLLRLKFAKRLLKLGEQNFRVFNVSAPQLDDIKYDRIIKNRYVNLNNKLFNLKKKNL